MNTLVNYLNEENLSNIILYSFIFISMFYISEVGGYFWHRWGAHTNIVPPVRQTHYIHHLADLSHEAHEDFFWVIVLLVSLGIFLTYLYYKNWINLTILMIIYIPVIITFTWNWYIHSAYHHKDHWLNQYEWFQNDKRSHFQHHINPKCNYSIATHFTDEFFNTFEYGFPIDNEVN